MRTESRTVPVFGRPKFWSMRGAASGSAPATVMRPRLRGCSRTVRTAKPSWNGWRQGLSQGRERRRRQQELQVGRVHALGLHEAHHPARHVAGETFAAQVGAHHRAADAVQPQLAHEGTGARAAPSR